MTPIQEEISIDQNDLKNLKESSIYLLKRIDENNTTLVTESNNHEHVVHGIEKESFIKNDSQLNNLKVGFKNLDINLCESNQKTEIIQDVYVRENQYKSCLSKRDSKRTSEVLLKYGIINEINNSHVKTDLNNSNVETDLKKNSFNQHTSSNNSQMDSKNIDEKEMKSLNPSLNLSNKNTESINNDNKSETYYKNTIPEQSQNNCTSSKSDTQQYQDRPLKKLTKKKIHIPLEQPSNNNNSILSNISIKNKPQINILEKYNISRNLEKSNTMSLEKSKNIFVCSKSIIKYSSQNPCKNQNNKNVDLFNTEIFNENDKTVKVNTTTGLVSHKSHKLLKSEYFELNNLHQFKFEGTLYSC